MSKSITVNDAEPLHEWFNKLAREAPADQLLPDDYDYYDIRRHALAHGEHFAHGPDYSEMAQRYCELVNETTLSDREAEVVTMKEEGWTHAAIALQYALRAEAADGDRDYPTSPATVDEYSRRAREKVKTAKRTFDELGGLIE